MMASGKVVRRRRGLTSRQIAVIEDLVIGELSEEQIIRKHGLRRVTLERWMCEEAFGRALERHVLGMNWRSELELSRHYMEAAKKLGRLTRSKNSETARKACLDILRMRDKGDSAGRRVGGGADERGDISPESAKSLLAYLRAEGVD